MRVTGVDACRRGWVAVSLCSPRQPAEVRVHETLTGVLDGDGASVVGIDMPLGLLEAGWREADRAARRLLGPRRSSVFAIPPRAVWAQVDYQAASRLCRELTGQGFSIQAWGLRAKLLEANRYRDGGRRVLYEVHPELAFSAMAGAPLAHSKHTAAGRDLRRTLLSQAGIALTADSVRLAPVTDVMDAAAVAWSAWRIAVGQAVVIPDHTQRDRLGLAITIRY